MGEIYKITNKVNGKVYVGQTHKTSSSRWKYHIGASRPTVIHLAIQKYGVENFEFETLERNVPSELLDSREIYYISKYNSKVPNGYNVTDGGKGHLGCPWSLHQREIIASMRVGNQFAIRKKVAMMDEHGNILKCFDSISDAARQTGIYRTTINRSCKTNRLKAGGFVWKYYERTDDIECANHAR